MRLHTSTLTPSDVYAATRAAGMRGVYATVSTHGSRARARGLEISLTGTSTRRLNFNNRNTDRDDYAATWDEWGMTLAALFELDPEMIVGSPKCPTYASADAFHAATGGRFEALTAPYQHDGAGHRWASGSTRNIRECSVCEATVDYRFTYAAPDLIAERLAGRVTP